MNKIKNLLNARDRKIKEFMEFKIWLDKNTDHWDIRSNKQIVKDYFKRANKHAT